MKKKLCIPSCIQSFFFISIYTKINQRMINLGVYAYEEEALYARWYAEVLIFGEYRYDKLEPILPEDRKASIRAYVDKKVQRL